GFCRRFPVDTFKKLAAERWTHIFSSAENDLNSGEKFFRSGFFRYVPGCSRLEHAGRELFFGMHAQHKYGHGDSHTAQLKQNIESAFARHVEIKNNEIDRNSGLQCAKHIFRTRRIGDNSMAGGILDHFTQSAADYGVVIGDKYYGHGLFAMLEG